MNGQPKEVYYLNPEDGGDFKIENVKEFQQISMSIFDVEEVHHNCTVQILRNSVTGETSIGWYEEGEFDDGDGI